MSLTEQEQHVASALARMPQKHKGKEKLEALIAALVTPMQDIETALFDLYVGRLLDTAEGIQLDVIGKIVGQARAGESDTDYRRILRARIAVLRSKGRIEDVIRVARLILNDSDVAIRPVQSQVRTLLVYLEDKVMTDSTTLEQLAEFLGNTVSAGIKLLLYYQEALDDDAFSFGGLPGIVDFSIPNSTTGLTELELSDRGGLPLDGGSVIIDFGGANEQAYTYTLILPEEGGGIVGIMYGIDPPTTAVHYSEYITLIDEDTGFGDTADAETGGEFIGVLVAGE